VDGQEGRVDAGHLIVAPARARTMAFDLTAAAARQANSMSRRSSSVGSRRVTTFHPSSPMLDGARSCASTPPRTRL
jgi:hypothetical protein